MRLGRLLSLIQATSFAYRGLATADSAQGNYRLAMDEYQQYILLKDSMQNVNNKKQLASLNLQYQTEKKDKDIQSLNHQQQLSGIALHQASLTSNFIIAGAILLLILLAVAINRYCLKQRSNKQLNGLLTEKDLLLTEKEWLLREIHHRVKNNLQIGISLLNLQSYHIENEKAQSAIRQSRNRMYAMSLLHQRLYQTVDLKTIDMPRYLADLIECIGDSYASEKNIDFRLDCSPLELDVEHALPVGLILNETITNSLKYAFPDRKNGFITIGLGTAGDDIVLTIADDGVGMPPDLQLRPNPSMGMQLIDVLVRQLEGTLEMSNRGGLVVTIHFPIPASAYFTASAPA
jgi:two-component sensor histidine kinase